MVESKDNVVLLKVGDVMKILGVTRKSVYNYIKRGKLNPIRFEGAIRFTEKEVTRFIGKPVKA